MALQRLNKFALFSSATLRSLFCSASMVLLLSVSLSACGPKPDAEKADDDTETSTKAASEEEVEDLEDTSSKKSHEPKKRLSTEGKHTGEMVDGYEIEQRNEFLGPTTLKVSKYGARLESPNLTCIILPGKEAMAYNPDNGNSMQLTSRSAAMLAGKRPNEGPSVEVTEKSKTSDLIADMKCSRYVVHKLFLRKRLRKGEAVPDSKGKTAKELKKDGWREEWSTEIWATKELKVPPQVMKDCARLTMMPPDLGFPMRIEKMNAAVTLEQNGSVANTQHVASRIKSKYVIDTSKVKPAKFDKGDFAHLDGYKEVKDEMALMMSGDESELEDIGMDDESPKSKKKSTTAPED